MKCNVVDPSCDERQCEKKGQATDSLIDSRKIHPGDRCTGSHLSYVCVARFTVGLMICVVNETRLRFNASIKDKVALQKCSRQYYLPQSARVCVAGKIRVMGRTVVEPDDSDLLSADN